MRISIPTVPSRSGPSLNTVVQFQTAVERITSFLQCGNALVITGAGVSVDSGIRAYRGQDGRYMNPNYKPIFYHELMDEGPKGHAYRQRYWSRSYLGYPPVRDAQPNPTHYAIAALQYIDKAPRLITQNVDGLHHKASPFPKHETRDRILELHGTLHTVHCNKGHTMTRDEFQEMLSAINPTWYAFAEEMERTGNQPRTNPDGDVDIRGVKFDDFVVPDCPQCLRQGVRSTVLKPEVVFFGESIRDQVKARSFSLVDECDRLLLIGTTLATYSAFRLLKHALEQRKPVMLLNIGPTRADDLAGVEKIELPSREVLLEVCRMLGPSSSAAKQTFTRLISSGVVRPPLDDNDGGEGTPGSAG